MKQTTKICLVNVSSNEVIIFANKKELASYLNVNWHTLAKWFRNNVKIVRKNIKGCDVIVYDVDYITTREYPPGQINPLPYSPLN